MTKEERKEYRQAATILVGFAAIVLLFGVSAWDTGKMLLTILDVTAGVVFIGVAYKLNEKSKQKNLEKTGG